MPSTGEAKARQNEKTHKIRDARLAVMRAMRHIAMYEEGLRAVNAPVIADVLAAGSPGAGVLAGGPVVAQQALEPMGRHTIDPLDALMSDSQAFQSFWESLDDEAGAAAVDAALQGSTDAWAGVQLVLQSSMPDASASGGGEATTEAAASSALRSLRTVPLSMVPVTSLLVAGPGDARSRGLAGSEASDGTETSGARASVSESASEESADASNNIHCVLCLQQALASSVEHVDAPLDPTVRALLTHRCEAWLVANASPQRAKGNGGRHGGRGGGRGGERGGALSRAVECVSQGTRAWRCLLLLLARPLAAQEAPSGHAGDTHAMAQDTHAYELAVSRCQFMDKLGEIQKDTSAPLPYVMSAHELRQLVNSTSTAASGKRIDFVTPLPSSSHFPWCHVAGKRIDFVTSDGTVMQEAHDIIGLVMPSNEWGPTTLSRELVIRTNVTLFADHGYSTDLPAIIDLADGVHERLITVGSGAHVTLCGLSILGGHSRRATFGGAFHVARGGSLSLVRCNVSGFVSGNGGAVHVAGGGQLTVVNTSLSDNRASYGGAVYIASGATARFHTSHLYANTAMRAGGFIYSDGGHALLRNSHIEGNLAYVCGAVCMRASGSAVALEVSACRFGANDVGLVGGVIGIADEDDPPEERAEASGGGAGGGEMGASPTLSARSVAAWRAWAAVCNETRFNRHMSQIAAMSIGDSTFDSLDTSLTPSVLSPYIIEWRCPLGTYTPQYGMYENSFKPCASACGQGQLGVAPTAEVPRGCIDCPAGNFCPYAATGWPIPCPPGTHLPGGGASSLDSCIRCARDTYSAVSANTNDSCARCEHGYTSNTNRTTCFAVEAVPPLLPPALLSVLIVSGVLGLCLVVAISVGIFVLRRRAHAMYLEGLHGRLVELDAEQPAAIRELLAVACSPAINPLRKASAEIVEVADACQWGADQVTLAWGGSAETLLAELRRRPTRRLLFAGHTDARAFGFATPRGAQSLGFTSPGGGLVPFDSSELVDLLAPLCRGAPIAPSGFGHSHHADGCEAPGGTLELIVLNGCHSAALGTKLRERGVRCVVCWQTAARDDAARLFSVSFFTSLARRTAAGEARREPPTRPLSNDSCNAADAHAVALVWVRAFEDARQALLAATRRSKPGVRKFELADPEAPRPRHPRYPLAAGIPLLLCEGAQSMSATATDNALAPTLAQPMVHAMVPPREQLVDGATLPLTTTTRPASAEHDDILRVAGRAAREPQL